MSTSGYYSSSRMPNRVENPTTENSGRQSGEKKPLTSMSKRMKELIYCNGIFPDDSSETTGTESPSVLAGGTSRTIIHRSPLQTTTISNQQLVTSSMSSNNARACYDAVADLLPATTEIEVATNCGSCWEDNSKSLVLMPSAKTPHAAHNSNPVIEALGVRPKSHNHRSNKYNISGSNEAMSAPGIAIPTPVKPPPRKKYTPSFGVVPQSAPAPSSVNEAQNVDHDGDDAFLPNIFPDDDTRDESSSSSNHDTAKKNDPRLYTEADLQSRIQQALRRQESVLAASNSNENLTSSAAVVSIERMEAKMKAQLEEQAARWNEDLQERLGVTRSYHKKKQAAYKVRLTELELKCEELEKQSKADKQTRENEWKRLHEIHKAECSKLRDEIAQQKEKLAKVDSACSNISEQSNNSDSSKNGDACTPGFIRDMQNKISALEGEKMAKQDREEELKEKLHQLEEHSSHLESVVSGLQEGRKIEQEKMSELQQAVENLGSCNFMLEKEKVLLQEKLNQCKPAASNAEIDRIQTLSEEKRIGETLEEKIQECDKIKASFQRCIDTLIQKVIETSPEELDPKASDTVPFDDHDWAESAEAKIVQQVDILCSLVKESEQKALQSRKTVASLEAEKASQAQVEKERNDALKMINQLNQQLSTLQEEQQELVQKESGTFIRSKELQKQLRDSTTRLAELSETMDKKELENKDLSCKLKDAQEQITDLEKQIKHSRELRSEQVPAQALAAELRDKIQDLEKQHASKLQELNVTVEEWKQKNKDLSEKIKDLETHYTSMELQKEGVELRVIEMNGSLKKVIDDRDAKMRLLDADLTKTTSERRQISDSIDSIASYARKMGNMTSEAVTDLEKLEQIKYHLQQTITHKIAELEQAIVTQKEESHHTKQTLQTTIDTLKNDLTEKHQKTLASTIDQLESKILSAEEQAMNAEKQHQQAVQELVTVKEILKAREESISALEVKIQDIVQQKDTQVTIREEETRRRLDKAQQECEALRAEICESKESETKLTKRITELDSLLESSRADCKRLDSMIKTRSNTDEDELIKRTAEIEVKSKETIEKCEAEVREVREAHGKEIDDMLAQLDLVLEEQREKDEQHQTLLKEKDVVVAALGSQLAESQKKISVLEETVAENTRILKETEEKVTRARYEAEASKTEAAKMKEHHVKLLESEKLKKIQAVEAAREETIQEAEAQFTKANEVYRKLVKDYKVEQAKVAELSVELAAVKSELEKAKKQYASKVAALNSEIAELKANQAKADALSARKVKDHLDELERLQQIERDLQAKISQIESTSRSTQRLLAAAAAEKEELIAENRELKLVAEEAMSLYESRSVSS